MSQPIPDDEEWAVPGGEESPESHIFSTQPYSQKFSSRRRWNDLPYIQEELAQPDTSIEMDSQERNQPETPAISTATITGVSNTRLGNLISRPQLVDPQQEVIDTFSFAQHDLRRSIKQRQPDQNLRSSAAIVDGDDQLNTSARRISIPHPKASSPVGVRVSPIKKTPPITTPDVDGFVHPSAAAESAYTKQHEGRSGSTNTIRNPSTPVEQPVFETVERGRPLPDPVPKIEDMEKQPSDGSGEDSNPNSTPTRIVAKARQLVDAKGKSTVGLQNQAKFTQPANNRLPEPNRRTQNAASSHERQNHAEVTTNEGPRDLVFSPDHQKTSQLQRKSIDRGLGQAPQVRLGRKYPATPGITKPMRKEPIPQPPCRPPSADSNVSKRRAPQPSSRPADGPGVGEKLNSEFVGLTKQWNSYFSSLGEYRNDTDAQMRSLRKQLTAQKENIEGYKDQIHAQSQLIDCTTAEKDKLAAQAEEERKRAESSLSKVEKLHAKCQEFKTQLNAATEEHQRLYRRNREMILAAQKEQEARSAQLQQENEKIRADIQSSVLKVSSEAQEEIAKLNEETLTLRIQLDERQKDLSNEKDISEGLRKELDQAQLLLTHNVQTLTSQNDKILETLSQSTKNELDADLISEQAHRLDTVLKSIEDVRVSNQGTIADLVQSLRNDLVCEISGAIREEMTSKQSITTEDKELLTTGIGSIQEVCDHIYNEVRDDQNSQRVQYMYHESQHKLQLLDERLQETLEQWQQAESWNFDFGQANEELRAELAALEKENKELQANAEATQALNEENCSLIEHMEYQQKQIDTNSDLEEQVVSLEATISNLQAEVEVHQYLEEEVARLEDRITEKDHAIKSAGETSKKLEESLEKAARRSKKLEQRLQEHCQELDKRLESSEKERYRLEKDLKTANDKIQELSSVRSAEEAEMTSLREKMEEQDALTKEVGREVQTQRQIHERTMALFTEFSKDNKEMERAKRELLEESERLRRKNPATTPADLTDERTRRVVVQSPKVPDIGKAPLTVEEEREARRQAIPPKSIMRGLPSNSIDLEASTDKDSAPEAPEGSNGLQTLSEKPVITNHSMYNRPVCGASNDQTTHGSGSQKRARPSFIPNDAGGGGDDEHVNKRAKPVGVAELNTATSRSGRPKISQLMSSELHDSEDEVTEKDMSTRTFGGKPRNSSQSQRGGPLPRRNPDIVTYSSRDSELYNASQASIASSQTMTQGSQSQGQQRELPFKRRFVKSQSNA